MSIAYFKPIHFNEANLKNNYANFVEEYFNYGQSCSTIFKTHTKKEGYVQNTLFLSEVQKKQPIGIMIAKIISLATVIFPLLMLISKAVFRHSLYGYQLKYCTEERALGEKQLAEGIRETEVDLLKSVKKYNGSDAAGLEQFLSKQYDNLSFEVGNSAEIDQKLDRLVSIDTARRVHGCSQIVIAPTKMLDITLGGKKQSLLIRKKIEVMDASQKDAEFDVLSSQGALKQLVTLVVKAGLAGITYGDIAISKDRRFVLNNVENLSVLTTKPERDKDPRDKLTHVLDLLNTMPKARQQAALDAAGIRTETVFDSMRPEVAGSLYRMLSVVNRVFKDKGISFWACSGTLLGHVRNHGGMIPWDDDLDIEAFDTDRDAIRSLNSEFNKYGYHIFETKLGFRIASHDYVTKNGLDDFLSSEEEVKQLFPSLDIMLVAKENGKYYYADKQAREWWPKWFWLENELNSFKEVPYGPTTIMVPDIDCSRYLNMGYGPEWRTTAIRLWDHENWKYFSKERVYLINPPKTRWVDPSEGSINLT